MAIYHLRLTPVKKAGTTIARSAHHGGHRLTTRGAVGKAAYLAGERLHGHDGQAVDYRSKADGVEHSQLILPGGGTADRERLWSAIDAHPTQRPTATIARDMIVAFPHEFGFAERKAVAVALGRWIADRYGVAVDLGMHKPDIHAGTDERNFHAHYLISERRVSATGEIGLVNRELNQMVCTRRDAKRGRAQRQQTAAAEIRVAWQNIANAALAAGGHRERIDARTLKAQGIDREATRHRGSTATKRLREEEQARGATPARSGRPASAAAPGRTVAELRAELAGAARELAARSRAAGDRIAAIQEQRRPATMGPAITAEIGSVQGWLHDPAQQFVRAWEAADRASALRRRVREAQRARAALRAPTTQQAAELRAAGRERVRADKLCQRLERLLDQAARLNPAERLTVPAASVSSRQLDAIERELARHVRKAREHPTAMERR
ncbi:MAG: MobA/MobL family protein [Rhodospirillales bacterium]